MTALQTDRRIASAFSDIEAVEQVYVRESGEMYRVLTIVNEDDEKTCDAIFDRERELIHEFTDKRFDFSIIARHGRDAADVIGDHQTPSWQRPDLCPAAASI